MNPYYVEGDELREPVWIQIRIILMESWDPIGISGEPNAANEYDSYIPKVEALIRARASIDTVMDYLDRIASERMGFTSQRELERPAAERIIRLSSQLPPRT